jgi:hypothetical protein
MNLPPIKLINTTRVTVQRRFAYLSFTKYFERIRNTFGVAVRIATEKARKTKIPEKLRKRFSNVTSRITLNRREDGI